MQEALDIYSNWISPKIEFWFEILMIVILLIQVTLIRKSGFDNGAESSIENINQAFMRVND